MAANITFESATEYDAEALATLRVEAMRESLERVGRFDPQRARDRFLAHFLPAHTRRILLDGVLVGFYVLKPEASGLLLDHLYIKPGYQGRSIGTTVLAEVFASADQLRCAVRVGALKESDSNRFYLRHGFTLVESTAFDNYYLRHAAKVD